MKYSGLLAVIAMTFAIPLYAEYKDYSEPPPNSGIFVEAEQFKPKDKGWFVQECDPKKADTPSGGRLLCGNNSTGGKAIAKIKVASAGKYKLWFRIMKGSVPDTVTPSFSLTATQEDKSILSKEFKLKKGETEPEVDEELAKTLGKTPTSPFSWESCELELKEGEAELEVVKLKNGKDFSVAPSLDCFYLTKELEKKHPDIQKISPVLYARITLPTDAKVPLTLGGGGRSWDWKTRISLGRFGKKDPKKPEVQAVQPGESSDWVNLSEESKFNKDWMLYQFGPSIPKGNEEKVKYSLQFATSPDEKSIFKNIDVTGKHPDILMWMCIGERKISADIDKANDAAIKIASLSPAKGKRPQKFPVATAVCVANCSENVIELEMKNLANLGFNSFGLGSGDQLFFDYGPKFGFTFIDSQKFRGMGEPLNKCEFRGKPEASAKAAAEYAELLKKNNAFDKVPFASLADEPGCNFSHLTSCPECLAGFAEFLKANGVTAKELGLENLADAKPAHYPEKNDPLHYWSMRYFSYTLGGRFRTVSEAMKKVGLRTGANFACQVVGNVMWNGANWFELYRNGDLSYGWTEDWFNMCRSYQFVGFQMAVMRAACKPAGTPYGTYCIIGNRTPWDVGAKAFSQFARKLDSFKIFNYGPNYGNADSFNGRKADLYGAVRDVNFAIGAIEESYMKSQPAEGDVALLYSSTSDIWNMRWHNWFPSSLPGLERSTLYLLLSQCGIRADILHESDLKTELSNRKVLFVTDSHIHADYLPALIDWVKNGGTLYLGANALAFDHYNRPTDIEAKLGIQRAKFELESVPGILEGGSPKPVGQVSFAGSSIPILYGVQEVSGEPIAKRDDGKNAVTTVASGKGKVVLCGFFPGLSHFKRGEHQKDVQFQSLSVYSEDTRKLMQAVLDKIGVKPMIKSDNPMVEAHLLEAPDRDIIVLSSWTGVPAKINVTVSGRKYKKAIPVRGELGELKVTDTGTILNVSVDFGDFIECFK